MEQGMTHSADAMKRIHPAQGGFMLVTVLVITAVGLLFGAGALLMFRFQCQRRIDRQHELEKVYAVRSALNYIRTKSDIPETGKSFAYHTYSDRDLKLLVKPVEAIFPNMGTSSRHFAMQRSGDFHFPRRNQYDSVRDYEYGVDNWTNMQMGVTSFIVGDKDVLGLAINDLPALKGAKWWINVGMRGTEGWLHEDYGRRYCFYPNQQVDGTKNGTKDIMRLCIIRNVTNESNDVGRRYGWPLSQTGERALVFQIVPRGDDGLLPTDEEDNNATMSLWEYVYGSDPRFLLDLRNTPSIRTLMGIQIAKDIVSIVYRNKKSDETADNRPYVFSSITNLSYETYNYFAKEVWIGGRKYGGIWTNTIDGTVHSPELRAVLEVEAASDKRRQKEEDPMPDSNLGMDSFTFLKVTPAYQYDVFLEHPVSVTNRATVAQKMGTYSERDNTLPAVLTYDTHGTEHKGFRRDERELARRGGK